MPCPPYTSSFGEVLVVSSTTRPTGFDLYAGRMIFETDTGRELLYDGTGWIIMYEPQNAAASSAAAAAFYTGITLGNGACTYRYKRTAGECQFWTFFTFGSTSAVTGPVTVLTPTGTTIGGNDLFLAVPHIFDASVGFIPAMARDNTNAIQILALGAAGTYANGAELAAGVPMTWATGDILRVAARFPMASPYT